MATTAIIAPIAAGAIVALLITLHGQGLMRANGSTRAVLAQAGRRGRRTWTLTMRCLAPFATAVASASLVALAAASEADRALAGSTLKDGGAWHLIAPAAAVVALIGAAATLARAPDASRASDG